MSENAIQINGVNKYSSDKLKKQANEKKLKKRYTIIGIIILCYMIILPILQWKFLEGFSIGKGINVFFSLDNWNGDRFIKKGISTSAGSYAWTSGKEIDFFALRAQDKDYLISLGVLATCNGEQTVEVVLNGKEVAELKTKGNEILKVTIHMKKGKNSLVLKFPDAISANELYGSGDETELALQLNSISILPREDSDINKNNIKILLSGSHWNADAFIKSGISKNEYDFTWTLGKEIILNPIKNSGEDCDCTMTIGIAGTYNGKQGINILLDGQEVFSGEADPKDDSKVTLTADITLKSGENNIVIQLPDAISPESLGESDDGRELALRLSEISFEKK